MGGTRLIGSVLGALLAVSPAVLPNSAWAGLAIVLPKKVPADRTRSIDGDRSSVLQVATTAASPTARDR